MTLLRAVLHVHSTWSYDGHWSLPAIARLYGSLGVRAVMMTEHDTGFDPAEFTTYRAACEAASTSQCTLIPGIEYSSPDNDIHILTWGLNRFLREGRPVSETLQSVQDGGGVAVFAHPIRRAVWKRFDPAWTRYLCAIELWNRKADGLSWGAEALSLIEQTGLAATVGQDFHRWRQLYPLTQVFEIPSAALPAPQDLEAALVHSLATGKSTPQAYRQPLLGPEGRPTSRRHPQMQKLFVNAKAVLRRK